MSPNAKGNLYDRFVGTLSPGCVGLIRRADAGAWNENSGGLAINGACFVGAPPYQPSSEAQDDAFSWMYSAGHFARRFFSFSPPVR